MLVPNPSPTLAKNLASMGPRILSSIGIGVWRKAPEAFPDSNTILDTIESEINKCELAEKVRCLKWFTVPPFDTQFHQPSPEI